MNRKIQILETKSSYPTLKVGNAYIYSKYSPMKNIKVFWDNNKEKYLLSKNIAMYGLGLGYHVLELLNRVDENYKISIFDLDEECYKIVKKTDYIKNIMKNDNVEIIIGNSKEALGRFKNRIEKANNLVIIDSILKSAPEKYEDLKNVINDFRLASIGIERLSKKMELCRKENQSIKWEDIKIFIENNSYKSKPIIIVSSGPSLDEKAFTLLKKYREYITIYSVGRSLRALINNGIYPDMFCIIDCEDVVYEHVKGLENLDIPMTFLSTANSSAVKNYNGSKFIFYNEDVGGNLIIHTGKSVATAVLDISIKCSPTKIIFMGQDLAYTDGLPHSSYSTYNYDDLLEGVHNFKQIESIEGKKIATTSGLEAFRRWIENKIQFNTHIKFYNYSRGAKIKGTKVIDELDFQEIIN